MRPKPIFQLSAVLLTLSAPALSQLVAVTLTLPASAQSPAPTTFLLPESLPDNNTIKIDGSASMELINQALKQQFTQKFSSATVDLATNGTDQALQALLNGDITLAAIGRPLTDAEKAQGLVEVPISREKIAIIVSPDNPFQGDITFEQFAHIFRGELTDWSELGGSSVPIRFIDRPETSDTRQSFKNYPVFQAAPFATGTNATQIESDETATVIKALGNDGISYAIADQVLNQDKVKIIPMHQTMPDDPRYPFSQPRSYVYKDSPDPAATAFLGFATSAPGQAAIATAKSAEATAVAGAVAAPETASSPVTVSPTTTSEETPVTTTRPTSEVETAQAPAAPTAIDRGGWPWWLWLLGIPILGGLLWWLLKGRSAAGTAPGIGTAEPIGRAAPIAVPPPIAVPEARMILTPRDCRHAYAYWEVPEDRKARFREQGGHKLALRLYDVTQLNSEQQLPHSVQFDCRDNEPDLQVPIAVDDRDYVAELGYVTAAGQWLPVARSKPVRVPACVPTPASSAVAPVEPPAVEPANLELPNLGGAVVAGAALAGGAALTGAALQSESALPAAVPGISRLVLTPRNLQAAYAYWEVPAADKAALQQPGGHQFALRLHDVTGADLNQLSEPIQQIPCDQSEPDQHLSLPAADRDYLAEIGYLTADGQWLKLARSNMIHIPAASITGGLGVAATGVVRSVTSDLRPSEIERPQQPVPHPHAVAEPAINPAAVNPATPTERCSIQQITVHSRHNCYVLNEAQIRQLQEQTAVSKTLEPGTHLIRIKGGSFGYGATPEASESIVLIWMHGGQVINKKTNVPVDATWSTLNGYDETLTLEVKATTTLHAFFFGTHLEDNDGEVLLSVISLPERR